MATLFEQVVFSCLRDAFHVICLDVRRDFGDLLLFILFQSIESPMDFRYIILDIIQYSAGQTILLDLQACMHWSRCCSESPCPLSWNGGTIRRKDL